MDPLQLIQSLSSSISLGDQAKNSAHFFAHPIGPTLRHASCLHAAVALPAKYEIDHTNTMTSPASCLACSINDATYKTIGINKGYTSLLDDPEIRGRHGKHFSLSKLQLRRIQEVLAIWDCFRDTWHGVERKAVSGSGRESLSMYFTNLHESEMKLVLRWQTCEVVCMITGAQEVIDLM